MKRSYNLILTTVVILMTGTLLFLPESASAAGKLTLTAVKVDKAPQSLDDPQWEQAKALDVPFEGKEKFAGQKAVVTTKAVYFADNIYFLFHWPDATKSLTKGAWMYDGQKWARQKGNEDRISLLFEINRIQNFASKGCAITCHVPDGKSAKEGKFGVKSAAEKGDLWHWKAARSDPQGFADDTYLSVISEKKGGRKSDAGKGGDKKNSTKDGAQPKYMLAEGKSLTPDGILLAENAVLIPAHTVFKAGDVLTDRMPVKPEGSRADIKAVSLWKDGAWTVMLSRKLDTGHDDDVAFNPRKKYSFAMALFDDSGDEDSYDSEVLTLKFAR